VQQPKAASPSAKLIPEVSPFSPVSAPLPDLTKVLWPLTTLEPRPKPPPKKAKRPTGRRGIGVGAVIARALTAAGLMK
jgi:hypothetical protein